MTCVPLDIMLRCACALRAVELSDMKKARGLLLGEKMATGINKKHAGFGVCVCVCCCCLLHKKDGNMFALIHIECHCLMNMCVCVLL